MFGLVTIQQIKIVEDLNNQRFNAMADKLCTLQEQINELKALVEDLSSKVVDLESFKNSATLFMGFRTSTPGNAAKNKTVF